MSDIGQAIRQHHSQLSETLSHQVAALAADDLEANAAALAAFLNDDLMPHAVGEERHLYPVVEPLIKQYGQATATMSVDHEAIGGYVRQISEAAAMLRQADPAQRTALQARLQRLGLQLEAVFQVHQEKEERVYLPLFEQHLSPQEQQQVLDGMHEAYEPEVEVIDVRVVPPPRRHPLLFATFDALSSGQSFILVNDHDPKPLYYQFSYERQGRFNWEYLDSGPEVWRVRIGKS